MNDETLFHLALEKPVGDRSAFLEQVCAGDEVLRRRVEALLRSHETPDSFLAGPAVTPTAVADSLRSLTADDDGPDRPDNEWIKQTSPIVVPGARIGPYKLLQPIGEGGMGTVYMAEQTQPVRRTVALKLIKAGMDSRQVLARFGAERQALALMDHPNIAKVLDAGSTDSGQPYFVMELVKGVPITRFCDERRLTTRERLELAIPVCQAVQHAHQKGIIHRDLKPSNILIALYDGKAVPKVIDFGVAKATGPRLTDQTFYTEFGAVVGTLEYMSPEQAELNQLDIDTRSDIYSLGVLLYELLTGTTPLDRKRMKAAAILELLRFIREEESPRPSLRLSTTEELPSIAACRNIEPRKLSGLVRGELDWIVMKALEKDRNRRYETANGLAADLRRYLDDEPVTACPPSTVYRIGKFSRRHRLALMTAAAVVAVLMLAVVLLALSNVRVQREKGLKEKALALANANEGRANAQYRRAQQNLSKARQAVDQMLTRVGETSLVMEPHAEGVRKRLLEDALRFYLEFLHQEGDDPAIRRETALAYGRAAEICQQLGDERTSGEYFHEAFTRLERLAAEFAHEPADREALVRFYTSFGWLRGVPPEEKLAKERRAVELCEQLVKEFPDATAQRQRLGQGYIVLGFHLIEPDPGETEAFLRRGVALAESGADRSVLANGAMRLGYLLVRRGDPEAEPWLRRALAVLEGEISQGKNRLWPQSMLGTTHGVLGDFLASKGRADEAEASHRRSVEAYEPLVKDHPSHLGYRGALTNYCFHWANALVATGKTADGLRAYQKGLALLQAPVTGSGDQPMSPVPPESLTRMIQSCRLLADSLRTSGRSSEGEQLYSQGVAVLEKSEADHRGVPAHDKQLIGAYAHLGYLLAAGGDQPGAWAVWCKALERNPENASALNNLAWLAATCPDPVIRNPRRAVELAKKAVELAPKQGTHWNTLGVAHYRAGDWKAAVDALTKSMELGHGGDGNDWFFLAMAQWQLGDRPQARSWYDKAAPWMEKNQPKNKELTRFRAEAAALLEVNGKKD